MLLFEHALACNAVRDFPFDLHHELEHLVVALSGKEDLASVQLIHCTCHRPHVDSVVVLVT